MTLPLHESAPQAEAELINRAALGNRDALGALYKRHAGMLTLLASRLLRNHTDGEDVVQDVFVGLPAALAGYRDEGRFAAWLRRVTVNLALKRLRTVRRRREDRLQVSAAERRRAIGSSDAVIVRHAVDALPNPLRTVVILKLVEGYSHAEIGALLGISRGASEVRLSRALEKLRKTLGEES